MSSKGFRKVLGHLFNKYLFITNITISTCSSSLGDAMVQQRENIMEDRFIWYPHRTRNMAISGLIIGTLCHNWYKFLDTYLQGKSLKIVLTKVALDQLCASPTYIITMFTTVGLLEKKNFQEISSEIGDKFLTLYTVDCLVWPPAQLVNFYLLPPKFRVVYDNTLSLMFDVYTSHIKHKKMLYASDECENDRKDE